MTKENDTVSSMEIDDPNSNASDQINNPKFSINVLQLLRSSQMQHGLRHGDYARYRRYCTARLRRLYKSLKFTHGRGKYTKRAITASVVSDVRYLLVVLYTAERAWSHAMEKKTLPDGPNVRQRRYLLGRLRKAVKWATLFQELCTIKGDFRTSLEAEAYASYMRGSLLFEQDQSWDIAQKCFKRARDIHQQLGKYGDHENQFLCLERVEELEPNIRYCRQKIGESNVQTSELVQIAEMDGPALDLFRAKLEAAMSEARSQQAASLTEFFWLGKRFPISNAKTRVSILKAQELEKIVTSSKADSLPSDKKLIIFDKVFAAYNEARSCVRSDLETTGNSESIKDVLSGLDKALAAVLGQRTIERNQLLVSIAKGKLKRTCYDKNEKVTKPEELVRLYDLLLQNSADLSDLVSSGRDRKPKELAFAEECELKSLVFRTERCFYLAKSYSLAEKRAEAYALYSRVCSLADSTLKKLKGLEDVDQLALMKELKALSDNSRSNICIEHAVGIMEEEKASENLSKKISSISLTGNDKKPKKFLLENLDMYESAVDVGTKSVAYVERFPPAFQASAVNPIFRDDLPSNLIDFPSLDNRIKKDKKSFFSRLWW